MELNTLGTLIRAEAQDHEPATDHVEHLVRRARDRGRRLMVGRRVAAGVAAGAVLVVGAVAVLPSAGRPTDGAPAATPTQVPARPTPTPAVSRTPSPAPSRPPSVEEVLTVFQALLPETFRYSSISDDREPMEGEVHVTFTVTDRAGRTLAGGGIDNESEDMSCVKAQGCTPRPLAGGTMLVMRDSDGKAGDPTWYYFQRPDGRWVWFSQVNAQDGNGPLTRPKLPLTDRQVDRLLTAPEWDPLVARCVAAGPRC